MTLSHFPMLRRLSSWGKELKVRSRVLLSQWLIKGPKTKVRWKKAWCGIVAPSLESRSTMVAHRAVCNRSRVRRWYSTNSMTETGLLRSLVAISLNSLCSSIDTRASRVLLRLGLCSVHMADWFRTTSREDWLSLRPHLEICIGKTTKISSSLRGASDLDSLSPSRIAWCWQAETWLRG